MSARCAREDNKMTNDFVSLVLFCLFAMCCFVFVLFVCLFVFPSLLSLMMSRAGSRAV